LPSIRKVSVKMTTSCSLLTVGSFNVFPPVVGY
jgi:hypothetical protein